MPTFTGGGGGNRPQGPSGTLAPPLDSDLRPAWKNHPHRRARNPAFSGAAARARSRKGSAGSWGRRSVPSTPLLRWKFSEKAPSDPGRKAENVGAGTPSTSLLPRASARKIVAGIWHLRPLEAGGGGGQGDGEGSRQAPPVIEPDPGNQIQLLHNRLSNDIHTKKNKKNGFVSPVSVLSLNDDVHKFARFPSSTLEKATKWDPKSTLISEDVYRFYNHLKPAEDEELNTISIVSSLRNQLEWAQVRINELETERLVGKKKLDQFLKRLAEEKASWRSREHEKVRGMIEAMKNDLDKERKKRHRTEIIHAKLVDELSQAKLTAKQLLQDYEKERKARELVEEVCDELAKEIGEDKTEIETLKMEALRIRDEVEDEKKMLQMAEVWREERVQMKLIDAKLTLEEKYSQLRNLKAELEGFLSARTTANSDIATIREADLLNQRADVLIVEEIKEFPYQPPPASEDIYAVFEELRSRQETNEKDIKSCCDHSPGSSVSKITASPGTDIFLEHPIKQNAHGLIDGNDDVEDDSDWETESHAEEQGSSNSHDGSEPSVNGCCKESHVSMSESDWKEENVNSKSNEVVEASSTNGKSRKKVSSICKLWRSSAHDKVEDLKKSSVDVKPGRLSNGRMSNATLASNNVEGFKKLFFESANGRLSNGRISNGTLSDVGLGESGLSPENMGQWSSPDLLNSHMTRGAKGCIEWPRGNQKHNLKAKLMEARIGSQKIQLRHALKQQI